MLIAKKGWRSILGRERWKWNVGKGNVRKRFVVCIRLVVVASIVSMLGLV